MRTAHKAGGRIPVAREKGFTLIEIMMVVGILGMVLVMGMPSFIQSIKKDPLRQAMSDIEEACTRARAAAILRGSPVELVIASRETKCIINWAGRTLEGQQQGHQWRFVFPVADPGHATLACY